MNFDPAEKAIFERPFPFRTVASLEPLIAFWKERAASESETVSVTARELVRRLDEAPELTLPEVSLEALKGNRDLLRMLLTAVFPPAREESLISAAFVPFQMEFFHTTPPFDRLRILDRLLEPREGTKSGIGEGLLEVLRARTLNAYRTIARNIYGLNISELAPFVVSLPDDKSGLTRYFRVRLDRSFVSVVTPNGVPDLTEPDRRRLLSEPSNLDLWLELLPPDRFEFHGFVVMTAVDETPAEALSRLKNDLLQKEAMSGEENLARLEGHLREFLKRPLVRLGVIALDRCRMGQVNGARAIGRSLLLRDGIPDSRAWEESVYAEVLRSGEPVFVDDLSQLAAETGFERELEAQGFRNLYVAPLVVRGETLGLLELASPECCDLTAVQFGDLEEVTGLFATSIARIIEEQEDRVQAVIKKRYTAIHPVVEWRFREAALAQLEREGSAEPPSVESIVFDQVYPLYGMSDIRGSSELRIGAIQEDLTEQLGLALAVIIEASAARPRPSLDEMGYRLSRHIEELVSGTRQADERAVVMLLQTEVEPLFDRLAMFSQRVAARVEEYRQALDPNLGVIYRKRRAFEESVSHVNDAISRFLDQKEEQAQSMVGHYFEKYKTDGVEYNIYAGSTLLEDGRFDDLDLKNLKLWQLTTMAGVVWEMERITPNLSVPLETAHLILVQSVPLSICFRVDEKKFDVDGAYNIRYEIVKKRIDKAVIAGSTERLTQPGMIAIVYSQDAEAEEYLQFLDYLQAAGYLEPGVERLDLDRLQGVQGLKALRVRVADRIPVTDLGIDGLISTGTESAGVRSAGRR